MAIPRAYMPDERVNAVKRRAKNFRTRLVTVPPDGQTQPVKVLDANPARIEAWIYNNTTVAIAIGNRTVSFLTGTPDPGFIVPGGESVFINTYAGDLYAVGNGASVECRVVDLLDEG